MTENEVKETREWLQDFIRMFCCNFDDLETRGFNECVIFLKELEQYRAIGTVEEVQKAKEQYYDIHSIAEKTALIGLSDYGTAKEAVITEMKRSLDYSLKEYQAIGTIDEFKALKEKAEPKKPILNNPQINEFFVKEAKLCPACNSYINNCSGDYCGDCGQHIDWSE